MSSTYEFYSYYRLVKSQVPGLTLRSNSNILIEYRALLGCTYELKELDKVEAGSGNR